MAYPGEVRARERKVTHVSALTGIQAVTIEAGAARVAELFAGVFRQVELWHSPLRDALRSGEPMAAELDSLVEGLVVPVLAERSAHIVGAGFVCAPELITATPWHLAWWLGKFNNFGVTQATAATRRLRASEDPLSESFRDYTMLEWWRVPATTSAPHITGPYVDYLCTDDYTLTLTVPVLINGDLAGVVGADLYVEDVERMLLPTLRAMPGTVTLVNRSARVVVSTNPHRATGSILRLEGLAETLRGDRTLSSVVPIEWGGTPLALVTEP